MPEHGAKTQSSFRGTQVRDDGKGPVFLEHRHRLLVVQGPDRGLEVEIPANRLTIGTSSDNDLQLSDTTVSRKHCSISVSGDRYVLRDLNSTNGTSLDGTTVLEAFLSPGTRVQLGDTEIVFQPRKKWERVDVSEVDHFGELYGTSPAMIAVFALLAKLAPTDLACILVGETGTGKELASRAIHNHSRRAEHAFIILDCGAISESLIESELFGHERGAFTGADRQRTGAFEAAHGGTVFLDEIGELPLELQPKLLRFLESKEFKRLGSSRTQEVDVRVVAATHRDLQAMVAEGTFRQDLYYRLAEVIVELPPLRDRLMDLPVIIERVLSSLSEVDGSIQLSPAALGLLAQRPWPGNVRELRNVIKRAVVLADHTMLGPDDFRTPGPIVENSLHADPRATPAPAAPMSVSEDLPIKEARDRWVAPMEKEYLSRLVKRCEGDIGQAAHEAGIHRKSFERLLRQHGLKASDFRK